MTKRTTIPALDPATVEVRKGSSYPEPWRTACGEREKRALGDALGLNAFGVNLVRLPPGAPSSQRHWHSHEDEFVYVLEGELTLVTDRSEEHTSELQSLMRKSYAVFCFNQKTNRH